MRTLSRRHWQAPTIRDVARLAGVSPMTVSRVVNADGGVRPGTRVAVQSAIEALNYAPNRAARTLAGAAQTRLGLLYANPSAGFVGEFLVGSLEEATRLDVQLVFERCVTGDGRIEAARRLVEDGIAGVVLTPPLCESRAILDTFLAAGIPIVLLATAHCVEGQRAVAIDDRLAAYAMVGHLVALGHARIGFITGDPGLSASSDRLRGYTDGLRDAGLSADPRLIARGAYTYRSGLEAAEQLLRLAPPPTAIFASNDDMAAAAVAVAHRAGMAVPGDLSVVGFDDTPLATAIWPELTTIRQPIADMSRAAIAMLADVCRGNGGVETGGVRLLDFTLVRRGSDASPRAHPHDEAQAHPGSP